MPFGQLWLYALPRMAAGCVCGPRTKVGRQPRVHPPPRVQIRKTWTLRTLAVAGLVVAWTTAMQRQRAAAAAVAAVYRPIILLGGIGWRSGSLPDDEVGGEEMAGTTPPLLRVAPAANPRLSGGPGPLGSESSRCGHVAVDSRRWPTHAPDSRRCASWRLIYALLPATTAFLPVRDRAGKRRGPFANPGLLAEQHLLPLPDARSHTMRALPCVH